MLPEDVPACIEVTVRAPWATDDAETRAWQDQRLRHLLATDPGGSWVAEDEQGIAGLAQALRREDVWGLSLLCAYYAYFSVKGRLPSFKNAIRISFGYDPEPHHDAS